MSARKTLNRTEEAFYNMLKSVCGDRFDVQFQVAVSQLVRGKSMQSVDFVITAKDTRPLLVIEIDGPHHDTLEQKSKDVYKDSRLFNAGIPVARYKVNTLISKSEADDLICELSEDGKSLFKRLLSIHLSVKTEIETELKLESIEEKSRFRTIESNVRLVIFCIGVAFLMLMLAFVNTVTKPFKVTTQNQTVNENRPNRASYVPPVNAPDTNLAKKPQQEVVSNSSGKPNVDPVASKSDTRSTGGSVFCPRNDKPVMKSFAIDRSQILNGDIPANWSVRNGSNLVVGIEILQEGRPVARLALPPRFNFSQAIPGYGFQLAIYKGSGDCIDFTKDEIIKNSRLPSYEKHEFYRVGRSTQAEFYKDGQFTTNIEYNLSTYNPTNSYWIIQNQLTTTKGHKFIEN